MSVILLVDQRKVQNFLVVFRKDTNQKMSQQIYIRYPIQQLIFGRISDNQLGGIEC